MAMQRVPVVVLGNVQLTGTLTDSSYTVPANSYLTISAATLNNTSATARTVTIHDIPSGGSAINANQVATTITVPPAGSAPTVLSGLIGQTILAGGRLQMLADASSAVTPKVSGYLTTL
jgi:hypothetical protein